MIRRAMRIVVAGACLLSALLSVCVGWAWWRAGRVSRDRLEVSAVGSYVRVDSGARGLEVLRVADWPGPAGLWWQSAARAADERDLAGYLTLHARPVRYWTWGRATGFTGLVWSVYDRTGHPARGTRPARQYWESTGLASLNTVPRFPRPLPLHGILYVPHWWALVATAWPPLLWAGGHAVLRTGVNARQKWRRARRRHAGRCIACGYNLTGNLSGVCPECGRWRPAESAD